MAAHRYWRLYVTAVQAGYYVGLSEIELFDATYADVTSSAMAITTSTSLGAGYVGSNAFNDTASDQWISSGLTAPSAGTPEWIQIDLGAGNAKDVIAMSLRGRYDGQSWVPEQCPKTFKLKYSDDGSAWSDLISVTNLSAWISWNGERRFFDAGGEMAVPPPPSIAVGTASRQFWRVRATATGSIHNTGVSNIAFATTNGGADTTTGGTSAESNGYTSFGGHGSAFDSTNSMWTAGDTHSWVGYLHPAPVDAVECRITAHGDSPSVTPKDFVIEYWDGSAFVETLSVTGETGWTSLQQRTYTWALASTAAARPHVFVAT